MVVACIRVLVQRYFQVFGDIGVNIAADTVFLEIKIVERPRFVIIVSTDKIAHFIIAAVYIQ